MARNRTLGELIYDLRAETGRSLEPAHGLADRERLIAILRRAQKEMYERYDWPHLMVERPRDMAAGQRYYDFPTDVDPERVTGFWRKWGNEWEGDPIPYGIGRDHYTVFDSDAGVSADPIERWQFYNAGSGPVQYEVWPMPASNASSGLMIGGVLRLPTLQNEGDRAVLDDTPLILWAVAILAPEKDRQTAYARAQSAISMAKARMDKSGSFVRGGGLPTCDVPSRSERRFAFVRS